MHPLYPDRRAALRWLAALLTVPGALGASAKAPRFERDPFELGVASGAPTADGVVLWTQVSPPARGRDPVPVHWWIQGEGRADLRQEGTAQALPELNGAVHVEVAGLLPDRWYRYGFRAGDAVSPEGRTRTLPAAGTRPASFRLAYASCQRWEDGHYGAYRHMRTDAPDLVAFLGDYIYEYRSRTDAHAVRTHGLRHARTLQDFRDRYALYRSDPLLQAMHAACPWVFTWDDHEVENNYAGLLSTEGTEDLPARRMAAYQAYYEAMPLRREAAVGGVARLLAGGPLRLHGHVDIGALARLCLLDNRQYRDPPLCTPRVSRKMEEGCAPAEAEGRSMLGLEQEAWLREGLADAGRRGFAWRVLAQQTRFAPANHPRGPGVDVSADGWDGYPGTRQRLIDMLASLPDRRSLILGGDIHHHWVARVHADAYDVHTPVVAHEFCATSISSRSGLTPTRSQRLLSDNPHAVLAEGRWRGYGLVDLTPTRATVQMRVLDDATDLQSDARTLARFELDGESMRRA